MSKRTIIFEEHGKSTIKEIHSLFRFTILYFDKWSTRDVIEESEFVLVADSRGVEKISLKEVNGKDYIYITDEISHFMDYPSIIDEFLRKQNDQGNEVTAEMLYHAILDSTNELFPKKRLIDIYCTYKDPDNF